MGPDHAHPGCPWQGQSMWKQKDAKAPRKHPLAGNSLAVQWLGLCTSTAEGPGSSPGWETKILQATWGGQENFQNCKKWTCLQNWDFKAPLSKLKNQAGTTFLK